MNTITLLLWLVLPYIVLTHFIVAVLFRFKTDPYGWTSKSSEILEKRLLKLGTHLFHEGLFFVFLGHVAGLLVPIGIYHALGISDEVYHFGAVVIGATFGLATLVGLLILCYRRLKLPQVRKTSSASDIIALIFLVVMVMSGIFATASNATAHISFDYRASINPWIRGVLLFRPDPSLMTTVPWYCKMHILAAYGLFTVFPYTRLVHMFSLPITYLWRSNILYRKRGANVLEKI